MKKKCLILGAALLASLPALAHVIPYELDKVSTGNVFVNYLKEGFRHIIPLGMDHILFVLCVFFLNTSLRKIILQATMFTLAHSITLGLAMYGVIDPPSDVIEPLIAASIVALALENVFSNKVKPWRMIMVFLFGLIHGMGFAGALGDLGMPRYAFATALAGFNIGVELGQISIILGMYFLVGKTVGHKSWYRHFIVIPVSILIALVAAYWTIERIF